MDHLTRFASLTPITNKSARVVSQAITDRIVGIFGPPEILHSDQGLEFENKVFHQLQKMLGYKNSALCRIDRKGIPFQSAYTQQYTLCSAGTARLIAAIGHHSYR